MKNQKILKKLISFFMVATMLFPMLSPMALNATTATFSDLSSIHWAYNEIIDLAQRGVINGFPNGTYRPEDAVTREQFARLVVTLFEGPAETEEIFRDVPKYRWSNIYITAAVRRGIIIPEEYGENLGASYPITREEAAVWMVRALGVATDNGPLGFYDSHTITRRAEISTAVEIGLITGMPGNLFAPYGTTTRAQAAVLVTRMSVILHELTVWSGEEIFHYVYRSDVTVISQAPTYSIIETNGTVIITVYNANEAIRQLTVGDTFVLEPTVQNPDGMAGHIINIDNQGQVIILTARLPEALDEIFYEFEFTSEIDLLYMVDEIMLGYDFYGVEGVEIIRNRTSFVSAEFNNANVAGVILDGEMRLYTPIVQVSISLQGVNHLVLTTAAEVNVTASSQAAFDNVFTAFTIPIRKFGTGVDVPVGLRVTSYGHFHLEFMCRLDAEFGIRNNRPSARASLNYAFNMDFNARATISLNIQARARVLWINVYGIQGDFGRGLQADTAMQERCPTGSCFVVALFHVRQISSLTDWGILRNADLLQFNWNFAPIGVDMRYLSGGRWHRHCPHRGASDSLDNEHIHSVDESNIANLTGEWLTLGQIQNTDGVYIKRGDRFLRITNRGVGEFSPRTIALNPETYVHHVLEYGDQLVFVRQEPRLYNLLSHGFMPLYHNMAVFSQFRYIGAPIEFLPSHLDWMAGAHGAGYTHLNGVEIANNPHVQNYIYRINLRMPILSGILIGQRNQEFTLGRWQGTNFIETVITADIEFFTRASLSHTVERTMDGYFIIDFTRVFASERLLIRQTSWAGTTNYVIDIGRVIDFPIGLPNVSVASVPTHPSTPIIDFESIIEETTLDTPVTNLEMYGQITPFGRQVAEDFLAREEFMAIFTEAPRLPYEFFPYAFHLLNLDNNGIPDIVIHYSAMFARGGPDPTLMFRFVNGEYKLVYYPAYRLSSFYGFYGLYDWLSHGEYLAFAPSVNNFFTNSAGNIITFIEARELGFIGNGGYAYISFNNNMMEMEIIATLRGYLREDNWYLYWHNRITDERFLSDLTQWEREVYEYPRTIPGMQNEILTPIPSLLELQKSIATAIKQKHGL